MNRVRWDGLPLDDASIELPPNLAETIFDYLPKPLSITPVIEDLARRYRAGQIVPQDYAAMQSAAFILPKSREHHEERRSAFRARAAEAEAQGFAIPSAFRRLVETDAWVDLLHHNCIWLRMPEEVWRLPADPSLLVFLAFSEGQGCGNWHLLLAPDGTHSVVWCEHPFGMRSCWPGEEPLECSEWTVTRCADSVEEWLYYYFLDSANHDRNYVERLRPYHPEGWSGYRETLSQD